MVLKDNIKAYRKILELTLEDVAKAIGVTKQTVQKYESGVISNIPSDKIESMAALFHCSPSQLMGWDTKTDKSLPSDPNFLPYVRGRRIPILGSIPAGAPLLAEQNIVGYDYADVPEGQDYFFLRVKGDSMINAHIFNNDLVLVRAQNCADNGNVVVCLVNGDEATLKRFNQQGDMVILQPENSAYQPIIVPCKDFDSGHARILGVAKEVKHLL